MWRWMMIVAGATGLGGQAPAPSAPPPAAETETLAYRADSASRMTVPVTLGDRGPFRFVIDTGAERTIISRELAARLALAASSDVRLASIADVRDVPTVIIPQLSVGRRSLADVQAPALLREHIGAEGMLGVDSLQQQRVLFDFRRQEIRLARSQAVEERWAEGTIVVIGRTRLGRLVLIDATVEGQRVSAIVDTGSAVTIGNEVLRRRLIGTGRVDPSQVIELTAVTGATLRVGYTRTRSIRLGDARIHDLPIAFADAELFRELGLADRPAILLGMDALRLFERVSIDFARRRVRLLPGPGTALPAPLRVAAR